MTPRPAAWRGWLLALLLAPGGAGLHVAGAEGAPFPRSRGFQSCFTFSYQGLEVEMALEVVAATATALHLAGIASFVQDPSRPTVAVTGVARPRVTDPDLDFGVSFPGFFFSRFRLSGRLLAPGYAGGSATIYRFTDAFPVSAEVPLTPVACPTEQGDF